MYNYIVYCDKETERLGWVPVNTRAERQKFRCFTNKFKKLTLICKPVNNNLSETH